MEYLNKRNASWVASWQACLTVVPLAPEDKWHSLYIDEAVRQARASLPQLARGLPLLDPLLHSEFSKRTQTSTHLFESGKTQSAYPGVSDEVCTTQDASAWDRWSQPWPPVPVG
jgi:hypothetical protein